MPSLCSPSTSAAADGRRQGPRPARRAGRPAGAARLRAHRGRRVPGRARRAGCARPASSSDSCAPRSGTSASASARSSEPLADHARAGRGPAYLHARDAVTARQEQPLAPAGRAATTRPRGPSRPRCGCGPRSWPAVRPRGWEVADLVAEGLSYAEAGERLGISQSAVSQRAQAAGIVESRRARELATDLAACLLAGRSRHEPGQLGRAGPACCSAARWRASASPGR